MVTIWASTGLLHRQQEPGIQDSVRRQRVVSNGLIARRGSSIGMLTSVWMVSNSGPNAIFPFATKPSRRD